MYEMSQTKDGRERKKIPKEHGASYRGCRGYSGQNGNNKKFIPLLKVLIGIQGQLPAQMSVENIASCFDLTVLDHLHHAS